LRHNNPFHSQIEQPPGGISRQGGGAGVGFDDGDGVGTGVGAGGADVLIERVTPRMIATTTEIAATPIKIYMKRLNLLQTAASSRLETATASSSYRMGSRLGSLFSSTRRALP